MAGKRSVDSQRGRLTIADFSHHDDIRVLAHESPKAHAEIKPDFRLDLSLIYSGHLILDRILDSGNIDLGRIQNINHRVKRCRLSASCRTGSQNHSRFLLHPRVDALKSFTVKTEGFQTETGRCFPQEAHNSFFAKMSR